MDFFIYLFIFIFFYVYVSLMSFKEVLATVKYHVSKSNISSYLKKVNAHSVHSAALSIVKLKL